MIEFFEGSHISELIKLMLAHIKTLVDNPRIPESGFMPDKIMNLQINVHRLALTRGSSYNELWNREKVKRQR